MRPLGGLLGGMNILPNGGVPLIDKDAPPLVAHVSTPKVGDISLRYGQFLAYPLRAPRATELHINSAFEGERFVVLKIEPDERPEMAWTKEIAPGDCVTMTSPPHVVIMRADLADTVPLGAINRTKNEKGQVIGEVLNMNAGQILAWDRRNLVDGEFEDIGKRLGRMKAEHDREQELSMGPHA